MTASFDIALASAKDRIRFAVADTDVPDGALRQDEQYVAVLSLAGSEDLATAQMAESLAAEFAQKPDSYSESGGISVRWSERVKTWLSLASGIRTSLTAAAGGQGGVSGQMVRVPDGGYPSEYGPCHGVPVRVLRGRGWTWSDS